jgi:hypothetical protein
MVTQSYRDFIGASDMSASCRTEWPPLRKGGLKEDVFPMLRLWHHVCEIYYEELLKGCLCPDERMKLLGKISYHLHKQSAVR